MLGHQQGLWVTLLHRGHDDFHTKPIDTLGQPLAVQILMSTLRETVGA